MNIVEIFFAVDEAGVELLLNLVTYGIWHQESIITLELIKIPMLEDHIR